MDFSKFDEQIDKKQLANQVKEAQENPDQYEETPDGTYICKLENLEVGETKDHRPMLKAMFRIVEGEQKKRCLFANRVLYGTKNDASMIASAIGFLQKLDSEYEVYFESYSQFAELVLDIFEDVEEALEYKIDYKKEAFNSISITDVFEV